MSSWLVSHADRICARPFTSDYTSLTCVCLSQGTDPKRATVPTGTLCESVTGHLNGSAYISLRNAGEDMRSPVWLLARYCVVVSLTIACGDASGPAASPSTVALVSGDAQQTPQVGIKLPLPLTIRVSDAQGRGLAGINVAWTAKSGTLSASSSITDATGTTSVDWTLGTVAGSQTATATVAGLKPVTFTAVAVAGQPTQIILSRDTVQLLGVGDSFRLTARAADQYGCERERGNLRGDER